MATLRKYPLSGLWLEVAELDSIQWTPRITSRSDRISAPGGGLFEVSDLQLSDTKISPEEKITISALVTGKNFSYVFVDLWLYDQTHDLAYGPVFRRFVKAPNHRLVGGVKSPKWQASQSVSYTLTPTLSVLGDGQQVALGCLLPESYGVPQRAALYQVRAAMRFSEDSTARRAVLQFSPSGRLLQAQVQTMPGPTGEFRTVTLAEGNLFTPFVGLLRRSGENWQEDVAQSTTLVSGERALRSSARPLISGSYLAGFTIQDMDDQLHYFLTSLEVYEK